MSEIRFVLRGSAAPSAFRCPGSVHHSGMLVEPSNGEASAGTAAHEVMARVVEWNAEEWSDAVSAAVDSACLRHGVKRDEVGPLVHYGMQAWAALRDSHPNAMAEVEIRAVILGGPVLLTGHLDVLSVVPGQKRAALIDWKGGRVDRSYYEQLMAYARLVFAEYPEVEEIAASVVWLRECEREPYRVTRAESMEWERRLEREVVDWDGRYHPGKHCGFCPRSHDCPALIAESRRDIAILGSEDMQASIERGLADMPGPQLIQLRHKAKALESFLASFDRALRLRVEQAGGELDCGDFVLGFTTAEKREIDALKAWPVMQEQLTDEEIASVIDVSPKKLDDAVAKKAGRGKGAAAKRALAEALSKAGAVTKYTEKRLRESRKA